ARPRQGRQGSRGAARRGGGSLGGALPARGPPEARPRGRERVVPVRARPTARHEHATPPAAAPAPAAPRIRDAPAGRRGGSTNDPGVARPQLAVDDADLLARGRTAPPPRLRPLAPPLLASRAPRARFTGETRFPPWAPSLG